MSLQRKLTDPAVTPAVPVIARYAQQLWELGKLSPAQIRDVLNVAASRMSGIASEIYVQKWEAIAAQDTLSKLVPTAHAGATFRDIAKLWTDGTIHAEHAEVGLVSCAKRDAGMFDKHVNPIIGSVPITQVTKAHLSRVFHSMASTSRDETRLYVWKLCYRVLQLACDPLHIIPENPVKRGSKPKAEDYRRTPMLFPEDDAQLLCCPDVPVHDRMLYGFLAREGMRVGEALKLQWVDVQSDVLQGFCSKTGKETVRGWSEDVHRALQLYRTLFCPDAKLTDYVFERAAERSTAYRRALKRAGIFTRRPELEMHSRDRGERRQIRIHDLRRFFVTLAVAQERSDAWIRARTGHTSSRMIVHYTDAAEAHKKRSRVTLVAMHCAIPELVTPLAAVLNTDTHQTPAP